MRKLKLLLLFMFVAFNASASTESVLDLPAEQTFKSFSTKVISGENDKALDHVQNQIKELSLEDKNLAYFASGVLNFKKKDFKQAIKDFVEVENFEPLQTYVFYYKGASHFYKKQFRLAEFYFKKALLDKKLQAKLRDELKFLQGQLDLRARRSLDAYKKLNPLVRRWKGSSRRADLLEILLEASLKNKVFSRGRYCGWFKGLYVDHPTNKHSSEWGFRAENLRFKGKPVNCTITYSQQKSKLRKYYLEGLNDEILKNFKSLKPDSVDLKRLKAAYHYYTGQPEKSIALIEEAQNQSEDLKEDYREEITRARFSYVANKPNKALLIYKNLYEKEKSISKRAWLLNEQASLNMGLSNFKTAQIFYQKLISDFGRNKYARRAKWGLPWAKFLNGQNEEAFKGFNELIALHKKNPRRYSFVQPDQVMYWSARALQKLGRENESIAVFKEVSGDPVVSYYAILSALRLEKVAEKNGVSLTKDDFLKRPWIEKNPILEAKRSRFLDGFKLRQPSSIVVDHESEALSISGLEKNSKKKKKSKNKKIHNEAESYKDSFLRHAYLKRLGFFEEANEELKVIKKYAKTKSLKNRLLEHFRNAQDFSNLARLSSLSFSKERYFQNSKVSFDFWSKSYPRAFKDEVKTYAGEFGVSTSLVWGLMRAESFFDPKILSPVGARGLLQMMPYTASRIERLITSGSAVRKTKASVKRQNFISDSLLEPRVNIRYGARYISRLNKQFKGHLPFVAAAYNGGPHRVKLWSARFGKIPQDEFTERVPFKETKSYIKKVMRNMYIYSSLYGVGADVSYLIKPTSYVHKGPAPFAEYWGEI